MKLYAMMAGAGLIFFGGFACSSNSPAANGAGGQGGANSSAGGNNSAQGGNGGSAVESCPTRTTDSNGDLHIAATAANNYSFSSTLTLDVVKVASRSDLTFDWSQVTTDMLRHPIDPKTGIGMFSVLLWKLTQQDLETKLNNDELSQSDLVIPATYETNGAVTQCATTDLTELGTPIDHNVLLGYLDISTYDPSSYIYTVMLAAGTTVGQNTRMMKAFLLDSSSTNTAVTLDSHSTTLDFTANLHSLTPTLVPPGTPKITIDWTNMTVNAMGRTFDPFSITRVLVASYSQKPTELEGDNFLSLDTIATGMWVNEDLAGTTLSLTTLKDTNGNAFAGIDNTQTWIVALECGSCRNPAPWYLSILKPCAS
jgi:hypothetical protein